MLSLTHEMRRWPPLVLGLVALLTACGEDEQPVTRLRMDYAAADLYAAPFPGDHRLGPDGTVDLSGYPNPHDNQLVGRVLGLLDGVATGFGTTSGVFFSADGPLDATGLPDLDGSVAAHSPVFIMGIDPDSPDYGERYPVTVELEADGGPYGAPHLLSLLPLQGVPLLAARRYAAVVSTDLRDAAGRAIGVAPAVETLRDGGVPAGMAVDAAARFRDALSALSSAGVPADAIAAFTVFTTADPVAELSLLLHSARQRPAPAPLSPLAQTDAFADYCVYRSTLRMPDYQRGEPPYGEQGGDIVFDAAGAVFDHEEEARMVVTIPRAVMPPAGWPTVVMIRTGGGGDRPLVDRGVHAEPGGPAVDPGGGPARSFARAGFAGVSVDGPHGGMRNVTGGDEQFLIFNVANPAALRDNLRQSAMEIALLPDVLATLSLDVSDCAGADTGGGPAQLDSGTLALMGHSMGATIAPLTLAIEPRYRAVILSGAGGSWIENVVHKQQPLAVRPLAEVMLGYPSIERKLHDHDPFLSTLQWGGESADPPVYGSRITGPLATAPRHVLMLQGIVDHYILPPIANATSLSLGLDLAQPALDAVTAELDPYRPLGALLPYSGGQSRTLPIAGGRTVAGQPVTLAVVQHAEDGIEDGHEVMFQLAAPKHQVVCFLQGLPTAAPTVVPPGGEADPCP